MKNNQFVPAATYEKQLVQLKDKFSLLEKRLSLKADEIVFTMAVSHRKEIDQLKDEVIYLREQVKELKRTGQHRPLPVPPRKISAG
ncbi:hypothetical protein [Halobacillus sp. Marseille-Q1614]|uniref:hypothetical protein n=1 Tax=Halobacillus sp. Marseille-Q1614 TaxID=2709134 RepID=UPI00156D5DF3|nr:hypothetical protein [Halobacillus sp. Marseille-Q1614]